MTANVNAYCTWQSSRQAMRSRAFAELSGWMQEATEQYFARFDAFLIERARRIGAKTATVVAANTGLQSIPVPQTDQ